MAGLLLGGLTVGTGSRLAITGLSLRRLAVSGWLTVGTGHGRLPITGLLTVAGRLPNTGGWP